MIDGVTYRRKKYFQQRSLLKLDSIKMKKKTLLRLNSFYQEVLHGVGYPFMIQETMSDLNKNAKALRLHSVILLCAFF